VHNRWVSNFLFFNKLIPYVVKKLKKNLTTGSRISVLANTCQYFHLPRQMFLDMCSTSIYIWSIYYIYISISLFYFFHKPYISHSKKYFRTNFFLKKKGDLIERGIIHKRI
jgi:hypothetical protein